MSESSGTVAFIGLGNMGLPMSRRLIEAGYTVRAFDVSEAARERVASIGAVNAGSAAEAAQGADFNVLMLPNSAIVNAVVEEMLKADAIAPGALVIDMSSSEPMATRALAERIAQGDARMIDAPVSGGVKGAEAGTLTIMVGGEKDDVDRATDLLTVLGKPVHAGGAGAGHAIKALNNLISATHLWATSEAVEAGRRFGLDPVTMINIINTSSGRSGSSENKWPNFIIPETYNSGFGLRLMLKDIRIGVELAQQAGSPTRLGESTVMLWDEAAAGLEPTADHTEVARWIRAHPTGVEPASD